jgi:hypothetical protein
MTVEAATTKMAYLLGRGLRGDALREAFSTSLRGELTTSGSLEVDGGRTIISLDRKMMKPHASL